MYAKSWHEALLLNLLMLGIGGCFYNIIKCMDAQVTASVRSGHSLTDKFDIQKGVKQRGILSPHTVSNT